MENGNGNGGELKASTLPGAKREHVIDAFATAEGQHSWFTTGSEVDPRRGGKDPAPCAIGARR